MPPGWTTAQLVRVERIAYRLRFTLCLLLLAMTVAFDPAARWLAVLAALVGLGWSVAAAQILSRPLSAEQVDRLAGRSLRLDVALALATYLVFLPDPAATPVALLPLLVFRLAVRYRRAGALAAGLLFTTLLAVRVSLNLHGGSGAGQVRLSMLFAWLFTAAVVLVLALVLGVEAAQTPADPPLDPSPRSDAEPLAAAPAPILLDPLHDGSDGVRLTRREQDVLALLGAGLSSGDIGRELGISASTVRNHLHNMREKLQVDDRRDLVALAHQVSAR